ncbi:glycoside hydrolase family 88 protein [Sphingobacterium oryzagri]|uniref:Glycoside hydrolase family 88 protein n=1 Tax=Sphingobacterium oryzagri TaxID=3025669 RepID=A0ABY7WI81_9SPHI|nr:glycoside hydrolase family 88 protein [Sphingobacterium sp. KACC 22765]WDF69322.1 glycoside hydrolase family 88 protein [Sphingobacterium sp. KACC 22765]
MRILYLIFTLFVVIPKQSNAQSKAALHLTSDFIDKQLLEAAKQIQILAEHTPTDKFPRTFEDGVHKFSNSSWWCSGFYPGTLLYLYEGTGDDNLLTLGLDKLVPLAKEQHNKGTHDLGFMLFCSFGNAWRLSKDVNQYKDILQTGAQSLASRFSETTKTIRSWDHKPWHYPVIIDNMMNLEFLLEMSKMTGNTRLRDIAITHANTTLANHFRKDYSSYHVVDYDPETGAVVAKKTHQGAFDESAWARGQGWALYGYTMMYRETADEQYLKQAQLIAQFILSHPSLPNDLIPYWDFDKDKIAPTDRNYANKDLRDVSAAALYASALLELSQYVDRKDATYYMQSAETILRNLSKAPYLAPTGTNGGFILQHSVGALPGNSEVDVPLTYADYYYVEALVRYQRLLAGQPVIATLN